MNIFKFLNISFLLLTLLLVGCSGSSEVSDCSKGTIDLSNYDFTTGGVVPLTGDWEFYWGKLLFPKDFEKNNTHKPDFIRVPMRWDDAKNSHHIGCATYRLRVKLKNTITPLSLSCDGYYSSIRVFVDGNQLFTGGLPDIDEAHTKESLEPVYFDFVPSGNIVEILIHVSNYQFHYGGITHPVYIGSTSKIRKSGIFVLSFEAFIIGILFILFFYNLIFYFRRRTDFVSLNFSLFCLFLGIYIFFSRHLIAVFDFNFEWETIIRVKAIAMYLTTATFLSFMYRFFKDVFHKKVLYALFGIILIFLTSVSIFPVGIFSCVFNIFMYFLIACSLYIIYVFFRSYRNQKSSVPVLFISFLVLFSVILFDFFIAEKFDHKVSLFLAGIMIFVVLKFFSTTNHLAGILDENDNLANELDKINDNLSNIVEKRTKEIVDKSNRLQQKNVELEQQKEELKAQTESLRTAYVEISGQKLEIRQQKREIEHANLKFKVLFEKSTDAHVLYKRLIIDYNEAALELFEVDDKELMLSQRPSDFAPKIQPDKIASFEMFRKYEEQTTDKGLTRFEWSVLTVKGKERVTEVTLNMVDIDGEVILLAVFHDMTARKKVENEIKNAHHEVMVANQEIIFSNLQLEKQKDEITNQKNEIENKNKDITSSINYASRIQMALLPPIDIMQDLLSESFVFYKPRDIVSGDFYWLRQKGKYIVIAAADCTGHGVPGAFMSMLGVSYLNEIVSRIRLSKASAILDELRDKVKTSLHQKGRENDTQDGMDIALCVINTETLVMDYAGAHTPLYIIRNSSDEDPFNVIATDNVQNPHYKYTSEGECKLLQIKANKMPIGIYPREKKFESKRIQLVNNDIIYLFSDGFMDQFGGENSEKFKSKRFKKLLMDIQVNPMPKQKEILADTFGKWKGKNMQIDDILVIGAKITFGKRFAFANLIHNWQNFKVLIVEDDKLSYLMLEGILKSTKVNLLWANNGKEGVEMVENYQDIDLVLMDLDMPVMNGFDAIKKIKKVRSNLPIIIQTTYNSREQKTKGFEAGCDDYITKPVNLKELFSTMAKYIEA